VKYAWIDAHRKGFDLSELCAGLEVSLSGYRAWYRGGKAAITRLRDAQLLGLIQALYAEFKGAYGSPRMVRELRARGFSAAKERVERLMRESGLRARHKRRFKVTTDSRHGLPVARNLLARNFKPQAPNQVWTCDLTYLRTKEGWLYLAIVLDLFNREVVGWSLKPSMTADLASEALVMGWLRRKPAPGLILHSDRGSQYASRAFQTQLARYGMICSMSRKGDCFDNAPTESWFSSFKHERIHGARFMTRAELTRASFEYIEVFYNRKRMHSTLGYKSPVQFLEDWRSSRNQAEPVI
jgi:putative transposase